ncbi:MAG: hypothetical protein IPL79_14270 [Myxococcales bacterium]|nr:hypothetical protein [Myxococcales bacterium]
MEKLPRLPVTIRNAGAGLDSGIGFHSISGLSVFSFSSLSLTDCEISADGNQPLALVSLSTMTLDSVRAQFTGSLNGSGVVSSGLCASGGSDDGSGGGGAGAATVGAKGAETALGGGTCATPFAGPKTGSGGGPGLQVNGILANRGGPPGGALQLSARYQISISGSFSFGGGGGEGASDNEPGGGGGSGGTLIVEANVVEFDGRVYANGGGGGGTVSGVPTDGEDGPDALGPLTAPVGFAFGGLGSSRNGNNFYPATAGTSGTTGGSLNILRGGGGGGLGFFRINTNSLTLDPASVVVSNYSTAALPLQ